MKHEIIKKDNIFIKIRFAIFFVIAVGKWSKHLYQFYIDYSNFGNIYVGKELTGHQIDFQSIKYITYLLQLVYPFLH